MVKKTPQASKSKKSKSEIDVEYIQRKMDLIERGLPIDISEKELQSLETTFRGARSFYIDILENLNARLKSGEGVEHHFTEEAINLAGVELALRKVDEFRVSHRGNISDKSGVKVKPKTKSGKKSKK